MLIIKSFFHKKNTKIYIILMAILLLSIIFLNGLNNKIEKQIKDNFYGSYISLILDKSDKNMLYKIKNISSIEENVVLNTTTYSYIILKENNNLNDNEIILPFNFYKYDLNDSININSYMFTIKDYYSNLNYNEVFVNKNNIKILKEKNSKRCYYLELKNYLELEKTEKELAKLNIDSNYGIIENIKGNNTNLNILIYIINIILIIVLILFIILYLISLINIFNDEKKINLLLEHLGYTPKKIFTLNYLKILSLIISSTLIASILFIILYLILFAFSFKLIINIKYIIILLVILLIFLFLFNLYELKRRQYEIRKH